MRAICWARIDDRLIHGQVTVAWWQHLRFDEIWVVDTQPRLDPYLQDALRMAAPAEVTVRVYGVEEVVAALADRAPVACPAARCATQERRVLLLLKSPQAALALVERGLPLSRLNVGNLAARPGSRRAFKTISLTEEHVAALDALAGRGVHITFQLTPDDPQVDWRTIQKRVRRT
jgi:mannose/fructose/N-acetylgalactosamine-specific phosphotransferase system component IIB